MLKHTEISNLGSSHDMKIDFGPKLTLITGDADLHQRLLLESAWRCMTACWMEGAEPQSRPIPANPSERATAKGAFTDSGGKTRKVTTEWNPLTGNWSPAHNYADQTTLYAAADGSFNVWMGGPPPRHWQRGGELIERAIQASGTLPSKLLRAVIPERYLDRLSDRDEAGNAIATKQPSGGIGRMAALSFLTTWAYELTTDENRNAGITLIIEEPELHLHPSWQREVMTRLAKIEASLEDTPVQLVASTNSPLVMASAEPLFDEGTAHWNVSVNPRNGAPTAELLPVYKHGTADNWLTSETFGLHTARNTAADAAIRHAKRLQLEDKPDIAEALRVDHALHVCLGDSDPFWARWMYWIGTQRKLHAAKN